MGMAQMEAALRRAREDLQQAQTDTASAQHQARDAIIARHTAEDAAARARTLATQLEANARLQSMGLDRTLQNADSVSAALADAIAAQVGTGDSGVICHNKYTTQLGGGICTLIHVHCNVSVADDGDTAAGGRWLQIPGVSYVSLINTNTHIQTHTHTHTHIHSDIQEDLRGALDVAETGREAAVCEAQALKAALAVAQTEAAAHAQTATQTGQDLARERDAADRETTSLQVAHGSPTAPFLIHPP